MTADPTPLRFRTYLWFPVLTVGTVLCATVTTAAGVDSGALGLVLFFSLAGLYVSALLGVYGMARDSASLAAAEADWRPSHQQYLFATLAVALGVTAAVAFPPVSLGETYALGPVEFVGLLIASLALATGPVCAAYLFVRWRRVGLNYL